MVQGPVSAPYIKEVAHTYVWAGAKESVSIAYVQFYLFDVMCQKLMTPFHRDTESVTNTLTVSATGAQN